MEFNNTATKIKTTGKYTNLIILKLKHQVQIVAVQILYLFARCVDQVIYMRALMINEGMPVLWIILNLSDF